MRRLLILLALLPGLASAQPVSQLPDIGDQMVRSRSRDLVRAGCPLSFDPASKKFYCLDARMVSLAFPPTSFGLGTATPPTLNATDPPTLTFTAAGNQTATIDWLMPSIPLDGSSFLLSWEAASSTGTVVWKVDWCAYALGEDPCVPSGAYLTTITTVTQGANRRTDSTINPFDPHWPASSRVVVHVTRATTGTLSGDVKLTGARVEFTQD